MPPVILTIIGWLAVALGTLGVFLPLLPTTPFILLAAWCFARSSPRFHQWLLYRSWFGGYLRHWQQYRAMPRGAKPRAIAMIVVTFAISLWLVKLTWVRIMLLVILACLLIFMWRIPVVDAKQQKALMRNNACCNCCRQPVNSGVFERGQAWSKVKQMFLWPLLHARG
ncbi:membrane protein [Klebsiella pneumoniae]|nr:membrane protein [Klebsiella pneumoniae]